LQVKGISPSELEGTVLSMRKKSLKINAPEGTIDLCGTGGAKIKTFNISTLSSFVVSSAGIPVAKHGNRTSTGRSGSADIIEKMFGKIVMKPEGVEKILADTGFSFLFAQTFHPSMKNVASVRKTLGIKTIFNICGPLTNPASIERQVMGVYHEDVLHLVVEVLKNLGTRHSLVVYGEAGVDEISVYGKTIIGEIRDKDVHVYTVEPEDLGLKSHPLKEITVNSTEDAIKVAERFVNMNLKDAERDALVLNSGAGIYVGGKARTLQDGINMASYIIDSGKYLKKYNEYMEYVSRYM